MEYCVGQLVRSKAGRDKGSDFIVLIVENDYVYVADGSVRRLENPKKKKLKHVQPSGKIAHEIADLLESGTLENYIIRNILKRLNS